jgi:hypothetical protein
VGRARRISLPALLLTVGTYHAMGDPHLAMSRGIPSRREFLTLLLAPFLTRSSLGFGPAWAQTWSRQAGFVVDVGILYGLLHSHLDGTLTESVDRAAGRYAVTMAGEGDGIAIRIQSRGLLGQERWAPLEAHSLFNVRGRESRSDITYDWTRRTIEYHFRGETFFLRRLRIADDLVAVPGSMHVDDTVSAILNYAAGSWSPQADGTFQTYIVRRKKPDDEGPDDVRGTYRAEVVPLTFKVAPDPASGKPTALFDMSLFSSWAKRSEPARITFGHDKRPELLTLGLILGTTVRVEMRYGRGASRGSGP